MRQPEDIQRESFRIIETELGPHGLPPQQWQVVQRVIHTTADFEYARLLRFHPQAFAAAEEAIRRGEDILTDVNMVRMGIQPLAQRRHGIRVRCHLGDAEMSEAVQALATTRTARGLLQGLRAGLVGICVIGNAPTALRALLEAIQRPRLIIGVPVGFVDAAESKQALYDTSEVPWITSVGRKGGSTVAAAVVNALLEAVPADRPGTE
jgi:precorrin-8X/cobalt-precorrin-8 methylmutase